MLLFVGVRILAGADAATLARFGLLIYITARPDATVSIAAQSDVELLFPFKVASLGAIVFIGADATEDVATTVVAGCATFDVLFGRGGVGSGGGSGGMGGLSLPGEANNARYSYVMEGIVNTILHWI